MSSDQIAREFLQAANGDMRGALHRMAAVIELARMRAEDAMPGEAMGGHQLELLWRDLHPHERRDMQIINGRTPSDVG